MRYFVLLLGVEMLIYNRRVLNKIIANTLSVIMVASLSQNDYPNLPPVVQVE